MRGAATGFAAVGCSSTPQSDPPVGLLFCGGIVSSVVVVVVVGGMPGVFPEPEAESDSGLTASG